MIIMVYDLALAFRFPPLHRHGANPTTSLIQLPFILYIVFLVVCNAHDDAQHTIHATQIEGESTNHKIQLMWVSEGKNDASHVLHHLYA